MAQKPCPNVQCQGQAKVTTAGKFMKHFLNCTSLRKIIYLNDMRTPFWCKENGAWRKEEKAARPAAITAESDKCPFWQITRVLVRFM